MRHPSLGTKLHGILALGLGLTAIPAYSADPPFSQGILGDVFRQIGVPVSGSPSGYRPGMPPYTINPGSYGQAGFSYPVNPGGYGQPAIPYTINPGGYRGGYGQPAIPYPVNPGGYGQPGVPYPVNPGGSGNGYGQPGVPYPVNPGGYSSGYNQPGVPYSVYPGGSQVQPPGPSGVFLPSPAPGLSQLVALVDQLIAQADTFLRAFIPTARVVPEGGQFISDTQSLRDSAVRFRQAAASGAPPSFLSAAFQNIQAGWQRLDARLLRVSKGNIGPNIANALQMGRTVEQIRSSF